MRLRILAVASLVVLVLTACMPIPRAKQHSPSAPALPSHGEVQASVDRFYFAWHLAAVGASPGTMALTRSASETLAGGLLRDNVPEPGLSGFLFGNVLEFEAVGATIEASTCVKYWEVATDGAVSMQSLRGEQLYTVTLQQRGDEGLVVSAVDPTDEDCP